MKLKKPILESLSFEIRYAYGHLYLDRCGQTLVDIEKMYEGWTAGPVDPNSGTIEKFDDNFRVQFNTSRYNFFASKAHKHPIEYIAETASNIWKVIQANLDLNEFSRVGCRLQYQLASQSIDDSNRLIKKSSFKLKVPSQITNKGFSLKTNKVDTVLVKDDIEYHIKLEPIIRSESVDPSSLITIDPRSLPKHQQKVRLDKLKSLSDYSANPMYAVHLDIDCAQYQPESFSAEEYISDKHKLVNDDFYFVLEELWGL